MDTAKKSMALSLRELKINSKKTFTLAKRTSVISTLQRLKSEGYRFTTESFTDKGTFVVKKMLNPESVTI